MACSSVVPFSGPPGSHRAGFELLYAAWGRVWSNRSVLGLDFDSRPLRAESGSGENAVERLLPYIRDVPDFPKPGVMFKDFTPLLRDPAALALGVEMMVNPYRSGSHVDLVIGAESRGFIFGIALARALSAGFVPVRKPGKLPAETTAMDYVLEYGSDTLEIHTDAIEPGQRVLLVDDLLATGGTMRTCCELVSSMKAEIVGITVLIELTALNGRERVEEFGDVHSVLRY